MDDQLQCSKASDEDNCECYCSSDPASGDDVGVTKPKLKAGKVVTSDDEGDEYRKLEEAKNKQISRRKGSRELAANFDEFLYHAWLPY